ncbi:MAG: ankyrin repeat domain-containing protein [Blastocatellia bacterium]
MADLQLIEAVKNRNAAKINELIQSGVDVNEQDEQGWTALNWAAGRGDLETVKLLVENGADIYKVGRDMRIPYLIALAAGHADVVRFLRDAESSFPGEAPPRPERQYCKAYHLKSLRQYADWSESRINWKEKKADSDPKTSQAEDNSFSEDDVVFLHQDYTVTESMWHNENVIFNQVTSDWKEFCTYNLNFKVPDDLDLIVSASDTENSVSV